MVTGNVTYMAPEQARGLEVDARADLFSVALVMYMLATGKPLYGDDTTYGLLMKAGTGPGVEERSAIRELPNPLAAVVDKATATRFGDRYQNARAMSAELEAAARNGAAATAALVVELFGADLERRGAPDGDVRPTTRPAPSSGCRRPGRSAPQARSATIVFSGSRTPALRAGAAKPARQNSTASSSIVSRKPSTRPAEAVPSLPWLCDSGMISLEVT